MRQLLKLLASRFPASVIGAGLALGIGCSVASAATFDFVPAPQTDLNRMYRIDRVTGEVIACQYGLDGGTTGVTLCFGPGEGAGSQAPGEYGLVASRHEREGGVFRVNFRTGQMSICYVFEEKVICTPQAAPGANAPAVPRGQEPVETPR